MTSHALCSEILLTPWIIDSIMNCPLNLSIFRSSVLRPGLHECSQRTFPVPPFLVVIDLYLTRFFKKLSQICLILEVFKCDLNQEVTRAANSNFPRTVTLKALSDSIPNVETSDAEVRSEKKSDIYSNNMTEAMGAVLTYRHELGMNYNFILPNIIVGSCLQTPKDVDKLRNLGVKTIFCLQQNCDLEYFGVDIGAIQEYAGQYDDIEHIRAEIRDFDAFDLRMSLPSVVGKLCHAMNRNGGVTYVHCTAGLGRAPAVALAYMFWVQDYSLNEANQLLQSQRSCFPKLEAIRSATADILTGITKCHVTLKWKGVGCSSVEIAGLDIGWGQRIPLNFDQEQGLWILKRELPEGHFEYKYVVDGEWMCNKHELITLPNTDGHVNNYIHVEGISSSENQALRKHLLDDDDVNLSVAEKQKVQRHFEAYIDNK